MSPGARPLLLAVDGRSGSGKTSLAAELAALLRPHLTVSVFHLDAIYPGWDGLMSSFETYVDEVLAPLAAGRTARWHWWDWTAHATGAADRTEPADVVILEGVGAGHRRARELLDALVWMEVDGAERKRRALARDGGTFAPHWDHWAAQEDRYLAADDVAAAATLHVAGPASTPGATAGLVEALRALPGWDGALALVPTRGPDRWAHRLLPGAADPRDLFEAAGGPRAGTAVLLESSDRDITPTPERSRYSLIGLATDSSPIAEHRAGTTAVRTGSVTVRRPGGFFPWLTTAWPGTEGSSTADVPDAKAPEPTAGPFRPGWMGWIGYGVKREAGSPDGAATLAPAATPPEALLFQPGRGATVDHVAGTTVLYWHAEDPDGAAWAERTVRTLSTLALPTRAEAPAGAEGPPGGEGPAPAFTLWDSREEYLAKIRAAQREITEGNTYEVCLTTQLEATVGAFDGWPTYRRLAAANRAPFTLYLRAEVAAGVGRAVPAGTGTAAPLEVLSTSPERFLAVSSEAAGSWLVTEPIKGTRPRGATPEQDRALAEDLDTSVKDRAENIMITDLARNDLSRFARPGTLRTPRVCAIESYPTVHQMVSTVTAQLEPGVPRADALAAAFPPGSMTGAPKISTMDLLEELEAGPRGVYSGVAGYLSADGAADLNVLIRTLVAVPAPDGTRLSLGVGGAITADSVPQEEWDEVRTKAHGVLRVLGSAFPGD